MALTAGTRIGHYNVTALIGEGGMGQVYQATDTQLNRQVALKILGRILRTPFISYDGDWVGYFEGRLELRRVPIDGGPSELICLTGAAPRGASWGPDGTVVFATDVPTTGLWQVAGDGGEPVEVTTPTQGEGDHLFPEHLPGGTAVLFTIAGELRANAQIALVQLDTGERKLLTRGHDARYSPTGHLVFGRDGALWAVGFDIDALDIVGEPVRVMAQVATTDIGGVSFDVSPNGTLTYVTDASLGRTTLRCVHRRAAVPHAASVRRRWHSSSQPELAPWARTPGSCRLMPLAPGTTLGPYEIVSAIGAGGMGEVYEARDTRLDRTVAIKVLPEHVASDPDLKQRFEREAKTISSLNHPHTCTLHDIGSQDGIDFRTLSGRVEFRGQLLEARPGRCGPAPGVPQRFPVP